MAVTFEFWPEYNSGPLWTSAGKSVDLASLPLPHELVERLSKWNARYSDSKLPFESHDEVWIREGTSLLQEVRSALGEGFSVMVTEPWWSETPSP